MFFAVGDFIKAKSNGFKAEVLSYSNEMNPSMNNTIDRKYHVVWAHLIGTRQAFASYWHNEVSGEWELAVPITLPTGKQYSAANPHPLWTSAWDSYDKLVGDEHKVHQEEIEKIKKEYHSCIDEEQSFKTPIFTDNCTHIWKTYNSGISIYEYCEHCDEKRSQ